MASAPGCQSGNASSILVTCTNRCVTWHRPTPHIVHSSEDSSRLGHIHRHRHSVHVCVYVEELQDIIAKIRRLIVVHTGEDASHTDLEGKRLYDSRVGAPQYGVYSKEYKLNDETVHLGELKTGSWVRSGYDLGSLAKLVKAPGS